MTHAFSNGFKQFDPTSQKMNKPSLVLIQSGGNFLPISTGGEVAVGSLFNVC